VHDAYALHAFGERVVEEVAQGEPCRLRRQTVQIDLGLDRVLAAPQTAEARFLYARAAEHELVACGCRVVPRHAVEAFIPNEAIAGVGEGFPPGSSACRWSRAGERGTRLVDERLHAAHRFAEERAFIVIFLLVLHGDGPMGSWCHVRAKRQGGERSRSVRSRQPLCDRTRDGFRPEPGESLFPAAKMMICLKKDPPSLVY